MLVRKRFEMQRESEIEIFEFIEGWCNPHRRNSAIGYISPREFERRLAPAA
jgi:putative transposase